MPVDPAWRRAEDARINAAIRRHAWEEYYWETGPNGPWGPAFSIYLPIADLFVSSPDASPGAFQATILPFLSNAATTLFRSLRLRAYRVRAGVPDGRPEDVVKGIPLAARYVFDIYDMDAVVTDGNEPVFRVEFDDAGEPYVQFAPHVYGTDQEVRLDVLATTDVADWADPEVIPVDLDVGVAKPDCSEGVPATMFFRWRITIAD